MVINMDQREIALSFLRTHGPSLPSDVARHLKTSILIASAILSELSSKGLVKISKLKIGSSPLYYLKGQEDKLESIFYPRLNDKDKKSFELLKSKKLLRNKDLEPITRVSLRNLGDFAIPFSVIVNDKKDIFWKWYSLSDEELKSLLDSYFNPQKQVHKKKVISESQSINEPEEKRAETSRIKGEKESPDKGSVHEEHQSEIISPKREVSSEKPHLKGLKHKVQVSYDFMDNIFSFFKQNHFEVLSKEYKTKREIDFLILMPTPVGKVKYFCKAWNKKRINEADLSKVSVQAQAKKLPGVLLINGSLTKKARLMLGKDINNLLVKKL